MPTRSGHLRRGVLNNKPKLISLDALLLFILTLATMDQVPDDLSFWKGTVPWINAILPFKPELMVFGDPLKPLWNVFKVSMLMAYFFVDLLYVANERWQRVFLAIKLIIISSIVALTVVLPTVNWIAARHVTGPSSYAHDGGVIQAEEAMKVLLKGENPYSVTYENTPLRNAVNPALWVRYGLKETPLIHHLPYLPMNFLASVPFYVTSQKIFGWYDQRFLYLLLFILTLLLAYKIPEDTTLKLSLVIVLALNPIDIEGMKQGRNDVLLLFWIVLMVYLLMHRRHVTASIVFALACGSKQMAWVMVPFFLVYLYARERGTNEIRRFLLSKEVLAFVTVSIMIFLPFVIWDSKEFFGDILSYHAGKTQYPHPIRGDATYGFSNLILHFGLINSPIDYFPFTIFQVVFTLPLLLWVIIRQIKENSIKSMLAGYTMTLFVFLFFGRYFAVNYIGFILSFVAVSYFMTENNDS